MVTTSAIGAQLGDDKSGMRLVKVLEDAIEHKYYALEDFPEKLEL
jgi:serine/threonine-protein phosphatase CPPED1